LATGFEIPPALEVERFFFITRPPSLEGGKSEVEGEAGALSTFPGCEKYSFALVRPGEMGEPGIIGEFGSVTEWDAFHCLPSIGR
jgi:hypothetical protein